MRITVAHVLRVLLDAAPPGALAESQKDRGHLVELATDALKFLNTNPQGAYLASSCLATPGQMQLGCSHQPAHLKCACWLLVPLLVMLTPGITSSSSHVKILSIHTASLFSLVLPRRALSGSACSALLFVQHRALPGPTMC